MPFVAAVATRDDDDDDDDDASCALKLLGPIERLINQSRFCRAVL